MRYVWIWKCTFEYRSVRSFVMLTVKDRPSIDQILHDPVTTVLLIITLTSNKPFDITGRSKRNDAIAVKGSRSMDFVSRSHQLIRMTLGNRNC